MNTPLWLTLIVALLSPGGALLGVWVTQRRADRRDDATFARELARERERWAREDQARTFEHRRAAYIEYYEALRRMSIDVHNHGYGLSDGDEGGELPFGWQTDAWEKLQHVELYASPRTAQLAHNAYSTTYRWGDNARRGSWGPTYHEDEDVAGAAKEQLLESIRTDLKVPAARSACSSPV